MKEEKLETFKTVEIPHLRFTVHFMDISKLKGVPIKGSGYTCVMEDKSICIFIENIAETVKDINHIAWVAHEIIHALAIMCEELGMKIEEEQEHMAYLMHYLLTEVIGDNINK
jgi:hypothetical protein